MSAVNLGFFLIFNEETKQNKRERQKMIEKEERKRPAKAVRQLDIEVLMQTFFC